MKSPDRKSNESGSAPVANRQSGQDKQSGIAALTQEHATESNAIQIPQISLPKGGGALKGIDEKFEVNAANGTAGFSIPLPLTPGRNGFSPSLGLSYNSGGGNSPFGLGWSVGIPSIQRKTDKRLPRYHDGLDDDVFMFSGVEDLVPFLVENAPGNWAVVEHTVNGYLVKRYRPRIEGGFSRIEKIYHTQHGTYWKVTTRDNVATVFGRDPNSRIANPADPTKVFEWLPEFSYDDKGNCIRYFYKAENLDNVLNTINEKNRINGLQPFTNRYLKRVIYGNHKPYYADPAKPYDPPAPADEACFFELIFDFGEHDANIPVPQPDVNTAPKWICRKDAFSTYRAGFEIRTYRLCQRVLMFHHFEDEKQFDNTPFGKDYLVRSLELHYQPSSINGSGKTEVTYLQSVSQTGYIRKGDGSYSKKSLPPMEFEYQGLTWNKEVKTVDHENIVNAPVGLTNNYQWVDLYGDGISGILTEQGDAWYYKSNYGDTDEDGQVSFSVAQKVAPKPSFNGLNAGILSLQDLESNGRKQIVVNSADVKGYFELMYDEQWKPFQSFEQIANIDLRDPNTRLIDLNGDGQPEIVISEENVWVWYAADGKKGHKPAQKTLKTFDEEQGPAIVFADQQQSIFLADMSGDGLTDIVRIRNGEVCYWSNMGYGRFSAKVTMANAPLFDHPDRFNPQYLHLADVSGTGATDILYLGKNKFKAFINLSGNAWSDTHEIDPFLPIDRNAQLSVVDLLGTGTSCIVWSSDLPAFANAPMRYIDLMSSRKPHVLVKHINNFGKETMVEYKSSTFYYLKDKLAGKPWITKIPFPVQVVSKLVVTEKITDVRFSSEYRYHHGYYDHAEREFRGFGMVEQIDSEYYDDWKINNATNKLEKDEAFYQKPVLTKTWFHTGAFLDRERILTQFKQEYWFEEYNRLFPTTPLAVAEPELADAKLSTAVSVQDQTAHEKLSAGEWREALRVCKGMTLRQEVFALDAPNTGATVMELQRQSKPYAVATHNCQIQLLQPRSGNAHGVFIVTESEAISIQYERDETDPRIAHSLNIRLDELGNILEAASVVYPRKYADAALPQQTRDEQEKTLITYTRNTFTNDVIMPHALRLRTPSEAESFEITELNKTGNLYQADDFAAVFSTGTALEYYEDSTPGTTEYRLIEHVRTLYQKDDLSGPLPLHTLESKGIPWESYQLAYTEGLFNEIYGNKIAFTDARMQEGRFVHSEGDNKWWIRSGLVHFIDANAGETFQDAQDRFYLPVAYTDPFGATTRVSYYKDYCLFLQETEDALQNKARVETFNFRTLGPQVMRDLNDNLSAALMDELGLPKAAALLGKDLNNDGVPELQLADALDGLKEITEDELPDIQAFFQTDDSNVLDTVGRQLLQKASSRFVYDLDVYKNTGKPAVVASIGRETHYHHLVSGAQTKLFLGFEYSDGLGNVAMVKAQAEPGLAKQAIVQPDGSFVVNDIDTAQDFSPGRLRWVGNGRTVLNNKGNPVKQYEPFFSVTPRYEDAPELVESGVTPVMYYDSLGRLIRSELPDGTFSKVEFNAWKQLSYDPNDTVEDSPWYDIRINNPQLLDPGKDPAKEENAALKAAKHHGTPGAVHLDTLGRPILSIAHNRDLSGADEFYYTRIELDIEGNARSVIDHRGNTVMAYRYDMLGHRVYQDSMDAGERWIWNNAMGNPVKRWDSRDHVFSFYYDALQRPLEMKVEGGDGATPLDHTYEVFRYGEGLPNDKLNNLRGQLAEHYDTAGRVVLENIDIKGNPLKATQRFAKEYKQTVDWTGNLNALLEPETYATESRYDALNRAIWAKTPDGSITEPGFNEAGLLETLTVTQNGNTQLYVKNIDYDAKGRRERIKYGNDLITTYVYDEKTFRLIQLKTRKPNQELLQDLHYTFDPVGNITEVEDKCIPVQFFNGQMIAGKNLYDYDALYRLIHAEGREHAGQLTHGAEDNWNDLPFLKPHAPGDSLAWRNYNQHYTYDPVGNIREMRHVAAGGNWTRTYDYETANNRLKSTSVGSNTYQYSYEYPYQSGKSAHGFITSMPHLQVMDWNFRDELKAVAKQRVVNGAPETTYYVYDSGGQRVRKVTENQASGNNTPTKKEERLYLGAVEIFKKHSGSHSGLERSTLHITDDTGRIAMVDTRNGVNDGTDAKTVRYQFGNHLGTVALETNDAAEVISYEEYHPYGTTAYQAVNSVIKTAAKRYRYTGMERDEESGFGYHGARYYVGWLGRWCSSDPGGMIDGFNIFAYGSNNPVTYFDSSGYGSEADEIPITVDPQFDAAKDYLLNQIECQEGYSFSSHFYNYEGVSFGDITVSSPEGDTVTYIYNGAEFVEFYDFAPRVIDGIYFPATSIVSVLPGDAFMIGPPTPVDESQSTTSESDFSWLWSSLKIVGGIYEMYIGGQLFLAGTLTSELGVGILGMVGGGALVFHGADVAATGFSELIYGNVQDTQTSQALQYLGVEKGTANMVDAGISIVGTAGGGYFLKAPSVVGATNTTRLTTTSAVSTVETTSSSILNISDDIINLSTSSKSIAPSRTYTIYDATGQLFKFGVTDANLVRMNQSLKIAGVGSYAKYSSVMPKNQAHLMEKYLRSLQYNSTGQYALPGMKYPYPVNFNTGLPIKP